MLYEDVPVAMGQYGGVCQISDRVDDMAEDPVLKDAAMLSGEQAAETIEMVTYGAIKGGINVFYALNTNTLRNQVNSVISLSRIRAITRNLRTNRGKAVTSMLSSSENYATKAIEGGFIAFGHTDIEADIRNLPGFTPVSQYGSREPLCPEECGSVENVRFILSPLLVPWINVGDLAATNTTVSTAGTNSDVYPLLVIAKEAFGLVPLKGSKAITPTVLNPGIPSKSDPLGQMGYVGWKTYFAAKILMLL